MKETAPLLEIRPGRRLHVFYHDADSPKTLFLLHGAGGRIAHWRHQIAFFQQDYNIVAPDNLGHGQSERPLSPKGNSLYSFMEIYQDHQAIFDRYHTANNVVIGHSYGGALGTYLALKNPTHISKLILLAPLSFALKVHFGIFHLPGYILELLRILFFHLAYHPQTDKQLIREELAAAMLNPTPIMKELALNMRHLPVIDLKQVRQPALVLFSRHDKLTTAKPLIDFYQQLPHVEFKEITLAGHLLMMEQPQQVNHSIKHFCSNKL